MTDVVVSGLMKQYNTKPALRSLDLSIKSGEFITLLGPSGCGKTTTLRCLAGLERPTAGTVSLGGRVVVDTERGVFVPPDKRHVGMVFQSYALWPHMSVAENVAYPLKIAGVRGQERQDRIRDLLEAVGLEKYEKRQVTALSGGQQQRVALARALAARPGIIFYDEPLSNLDTKLRYQMGQQVRALHNRFETTSVYVTHDQEEAITLSDRIIVMNHGVIEQQGTPEEIYDRPRSAYVADFMGFQNITTGEVVGGSGARAEVKLSGSDIVLGAYADTVPAIGSPVSLAFRSEHIRLADQRPSAVGHFTGTVSRSTFVGSAYNLLLDAEGTTIRARIGRSELDAQNLPTPAPGDALSFEVNAHRALLVEPFDTAAGSGH
ncbi:ABC transporter ATP-binding protein [Rhodococcoides yunnanense]|uniref:ABC transporter ATP-binding protein n=1 Tax=Rhodococcoides yunnanense TaxID=278209 RepID=UPI0009332C21|nr:ABC transporter ATP-binding protein [Rhodococcus yunnanensis]